MQQPIHLYTGASSSEARALAERLLDNLPAPAVLHDVRELPPPDPERRQQLRTERVAVVRELAAARGLVQLMHASLALQPDVALLRAEIERHETRLMEIDQVLGAAGPQQEGGPADG